MLLQRIKNQIGKGWRNPPESLNRKEVQNMTEKFICYEAECEGIYTLGQLKEMWETQIDKSNFSDFDAWLEEMKQHQILIRL